jgi:hypothetical protein
VEDANTLPVDVGIGDGREVHEHVGAGRGEIVPGLEGGGQDDSEVTRATALEGPEEVLVLDCVGGTELAISSDDVK